MPDAPRILITDGGPHSAETWADATVAQIVSGVGAEATALRQTLIPILVIAHALVQTHERAGKHAPANHVSATVATLVAASRNSPHAEHFARAETQEYLHRLLGEHFATVIDIERQWAAARSQE